MARPRALMFLATLVLAVALAPAAASAATHTFVNSTTLGPPGDAGTFGPANNYPSSIVVSGVPGEVTKATVTVLGLDSANADDIDMAIVGPNRQAVMLMSDVCGSALSNDDWTFDDDAATFLSDAGPCSSGQDASFLPSNPGDPSLDDLTPGGGPPQPYLNSLSFFKGAPANGTWNLFVTDDNAGFLGFAIDAWQLTLEVEPPAAPLTPTSPAATPPAAAKACKRKKGKKGTAAAAKKCKKKRK
jgi:hypothetical protein